MDAYSFALDALAWALFLVLALALVVCHFPCHRSHASFCWAPNPWASKTMAALIPTCGSKNQRMLIKIPANQNGRVHTCIYFNRSLFLSLFKKGEGGDAAASNKRLLPGTHIPLSLLPPLPLSL
ncbi:hypothetical protein BX661DRAFT_85774 [Kickxella alabastrina]|uniref:uncharacterized protein n=1 Tax=Kickxella alabastrina TaxID=61397 RepID=UPI00221FCAA0|nr:uncharacterized protein BX661DRAFT_85774 [Kickxella alabastrina]KAI7831912.1 hypothetical protein BX661DRAFT_85774 [Kickxella alabastrina]